MTTPTLIDFPPPPSDPVTPSDMGPGTPNSGTTSLSALSTIAIKDGHQGARHHTRHGHRSSNASETSTTTLDAERADRISRLAGLERVATRPAGSGTTPSANPHGLPGGFTTQQHPGYFDHLQQSHFKERSTVGSASATGSIGGRTTWASGSDSLDQDRLGDDDGVSSVGGLSDEGNSSLVGFGEGASSTVSGPVSTAAARMAFASNNRGVGGRNSPAPNNKPPTGSGHTSSSYPQPTPRTENGPFSSTMSPLGSNAPEPPLVGSNADTTFDARMVDGMTYDEGIVDTAARPPGHVDLDGDVHSAKDSI
ncbi:conserved hypothetical protein [Histoplasma capsulatum var. duboisii H88]|uniref:Uncharacterized protein n=1 Tax=Ajellomyces capsulatus (strain H88) TaxID=544711 RepID=F0UQD3_AJEC8|nr:conserved hypothetical protein [Histoplasma capsulatum var. duboisii H88]QSS54077.1 hypothetical protein I7I53_01530 [Histoplasma capsulatum var. duboisii H88]